MEKNSPSQNTGEMQDLEPTALPTTLHLFRFDSERLGQVTRHYNDALQYRKEVTITGDSAEAFIDKIISPVDFLEEAKADLESQELQSSGKRTVGIFYLTLQEEMQQLGFSDNNFYSFFKLCLQTNIQHFGNMIDPALDEKAAKFVIENRTHQLRYDVRRNKINLPTWLDQRVGDPKMFFIKRATISEYINEQGDRNKGLTEDQLSELTSDLSQDLIKPIIEKDDMPDWLSESSSIPPERERVEEELVEDTQAVLSTYNQVIAAGEKMQKTLDFIEARRKRPLRYISERKADLFSDTTDLADVVIFLNATNGHFDLQVTPEEIDRMSMTDIIKKMRKGKEYFKESVSTFSTNPEIYLSPEMVSLWIEQTLQKGNLVERSDEVLDAGNSEIFSSLITDVLEKRSTLEGSLRAYRETNKKGYNALQFDLKPILEQLDGKAIADLQTSLSIMQGQPIEWFIHEMAESIAKHKEKLDGDMPDANTRNARDGMRKFTRHWITNNWEWAYTQLGNVLSDPEKHQLQEITTGVDSEALGAQTDMILEEKDAESEEITGGNLEGWKLFYTMSGATTDEEDFVEIAGDSLQERIDTLRQFIGTNNISCNIKPSSVINTFDWLVGSVPDTVEQIRIRQDVRGEEFKKIKRGNTRILYKMDKEINRIVFFIEHKKATGYSFDRPSSH